MDPTTLTFDPAAMLEGLGAWVACESPTWDAAAVNRMLDLAARDLVLLGGGLERIGGRMGFADSLRIRLPHAQARPGILVLAHLDTVHPIGTLARMPFRRDGGRCFGPGILDMKGGLFIAVQAIRQLARAGVATRLPVTFLLTGDEEVGSPSTRDLIEAEAARHRYVLVPEPARADGGVVSGRFAIARFELEAVGRPSHASADPKQGRSAIREMARQILAIEDMSTESCSFSVGVVQGGQWVNCVPTTCRAEVLSTARRQADLTAAVARITALSGGGGDVRLTVARGVTRPVWEPDRATIALFELAHAVARSIGFQITHQSAGGGSDGNFTGALGIPTLDGLGPQGGGAHTLEEHVLVESLPQRARLLAGLLAMLD